MNPLLEKRLAAGAAFRVKVIPKSPRTEIVGELADGTLKIRVAAVPDKGKANAELCSFLSKDIGAPVEVISGQTSTLKLVRVQRWGG